MRIPEETKKLKKVNTGPSSEASAEFTVGPFRRLSSRLSPILCADDLNAKASSPSKHLYASTESFCYPICSAKYLGIFGVISGYCRPLPLTGFKPF